MPTTIDTIEIPLGIKTLNQVLREHWVVKKRQKGLWKMFIRNQMRKQKLKDATKGQKFKLSFVHIRPPRKKIKDYDNLVGGSKAIQDCLVEEGFLWDDTMDFIGVPKHTQIIGNELKTIISREYEELH